jgi:hypothetical protein
MSGDTSQRELGALEDVVICASFKSIGKFDISKIIILP